MTFEEGTEYIFTNAFYQCSKLEKAVLPESLRIISGGAFYACTKLLLINIPSDVVYIGDEAFTSTKWLKNQKENFVVAGDGVLLKYQGSVSVTSLTVPANVKRLPAYVFVDVSSELKEVVIPSNVKFIAKYALAKIVSTTDSTTGETSTSYRLRYLTVYGKKGSYAENFANHDYYTFKKLG